MIPKEQSPFTPGSPVHYELFVGRIEQIKEINRYVAQASRGRQENIFLSGERGIGKSSLAWFVSHLAATRMDMLPVHVFLGGVTTLEEMTRRILDRILEQSQGTSWHDRVAKFFGEHVKQIGLFGISVSFSPPKEELTGLVRKFPGALKTLLNEMKEDKKGLFIVLDDINGLAERSEFADWYKSFVDEAATQQEDFSVLMMLAGIPERRDRLSNLQPSLMRIFRAVEIEKLSEDEVSEFFSKAFDTVQTKVEPEALTGMVKVASGLPILMHEIGDAVFWSDTDGVIDQKDTLEGIMAAAKNVGRKYLHPKVYAALLSGRYRSILRKLGHSEPIIGRYFTKREMEDLLSESEKKVFHNFLKRMRDLGVIERDVESGPGAYRFVNEIYPIYIWMESKGRIQRESKR